MIEIREGGGAVIFRVRVQPGARRSEIVGEWEGALRVRVTELAHGGRANDALRRLLAGRLKVPVGAVNILQGVHGRIKRVEICGVTTAQLLAVVAPASS